MDSSASGSKLWFIADGYLPLKARTDNTGFEGHEAIMILNCNDQAARVLMDVYFEDREPIEGVALAVPARRVKCFRMDHPGEIGGLEIKRLDQYALRFRSDIEVIVQYGRMDISQPNLAYIGMMGYAGSPSVQYKKNLDEVISRNRSLWNREATGKILAKIDVGEGETMRMWERALAPGTCPDSRKMFDVFLQDFKRRELLRDDAMPTARPNIGDYGFGAYVGAEVVFGEGGAYAKPFLASLADVKSLRFDPENQWVRSLEQSTRYFAERAEGLCATSIVETTDNLNFAENVFGSAIFMEIYDHPRELLELFDFAFELNIRLIELQRKYIRRFHGGYFDLHEEWLPGDCVWLSIDAWGGCSAQDFRRLGKNHLQKMVNHFGTGWLHMHNSHLHLLEEVVTVKNLVGIGILDDPRQVPCFERLEAIRELTGDIPLQINCRKEQFLASMDQGTLPRNVMYWIDSGVQSVDEGNAIMDRVYEY